MAEPNPPKTRPARTPAILKASLITFFLSTILFSGWTFLKSFRPGSLQGYIQEGIRLSLSNFQIEMALAGLAGLMTSLFLRRRRRSRKANAKRPKMNTMNFRNDKQTQTPSMSHNTARDPNY